MPTVTNVTGTNAGPNTASPDFPTLAVGNTWKGGTFDVTLSPAAVANATSAEQTFTMTGLLTTDYVAVMKPTAQAGLGIVGARVSAADVLAITFMNATAATITPTASQVYQVFVARRLPNWTAPSSGTPIDW
jgi:hypothetical protein